MQVTGNNLHHPYSLSIRFHTDGFSFYSCNPQSNQHCYREDFSYPSSLEQSTCLQEALQVSTLLQKYQYTILSATFDTPVSYVPMEFFKKENCRQLYQLTIGQDKGWRIHYNILPHLEVVALFGIPETTEDLLLHQYPMMRFYAQSSMILERAVGLLEPDEPFKRLFARFSDNKIFIYHLFQKKLQFANSFSYANTEEANYYLLSVWKMLQMDPQKDICVLVEPENAPDDFTGKLGNYLRHIEPLDTARWFRNAPLASVSGIPFDILSLLLNNF